jgi:phosphate transport system permease protein
MLGFGRALGETMAVTMLIGNTPQVTLSLFAPQHTMAAVIANQFREAADELYLHALIEIGLVLFIVTLIVNFLSRLLIWSMKPHRVVERHRRKAAPASPAATEAAPA